MQHRSNSALSAFPRVTPPARANVEEFLTGTSTSKTSASLWRSSLHDVLPPSQTDPESFVLTVVTTAPPASTTSQWRQAEDGIFVATSSGEYAGFVAHVADGYDARGPLGEDLGRHASAGLAMLAVEDACGSPRSRAVTPRGFRSFRPTRPLRTRRSGTHGRTSRPE
ncbi:MULTISPECIES: hypothetical protein [unclassified Microbacterium]|uniref:hypothetical protein n=1 Tax=unclassified Microbacterium TaxID=2609290 RepID=UPI0037469A40